MKKKVVSFALAGAILLGSGFMAETQGPIGFLPLKPLIVSAEIIDFTINGITYKVVRDDCVSVIGCRSMTSVTIPSEVECGGKKYKVLEILENAFRNNTSVNSISIPEHVVYIEEATFKGCNNLKSITVSVNNQWYSSYDGVLYDKNKTRLIKYPSSKTGSIFYIPTTVEAVVSYAFDDCYNLETIEMPSNTLYIHNFAFYKCRKLTEISVSSSNENFYSINGVLYTKDKTKLIKYLGALTNTSFTVPKGVKEISEDAFCDAKNLSAIYVESGNTSFKSQGAVLFNYDITELVSYPAGKTGTTYFVSSSLKKIASYAFLNSNVTDIRNMGKGLKIDSHTSFLDYSSITQINGGSTLTSTNAEFILSNLDYLRYSRFVLNAVKAKVNEAQKYLMDNYQTYEKKFKQPTDEAIKAMAMRDWLCKNSMYVPNAETAYGIEINGPNDIPSEAEQLRYKYVGYIEDGVSYDGGTDTYYVDNLSSSRYHNAIGALLMPFTVCEGYAEAYQLLLKSVSVECEVVNNVYNTHVWNVVKIGNKYYSVDCTADDIENSSPSNYHFLRIPDHFSQMGSNYMNPKVINHGDQNELIYSVLGINHNAVSYEHIRSNAAVSGIELK